MMKLIRREFFAIGAMLALSGCGSSSGSKEKQEDATDPEQEQSEKLIEVDETTYYDVFRCDYQEGLFGDVTVYTSNTMDFGDSYAVLEPDGTFNFNINGVPYNGKISLGKETTHLYSGDSDAKVTQILFDGKVDTTVGSVLIQGYYVDGYPLIEMITDVDGKQVFATFYLWKHVDE